jgi:hypothetical protein
VGATRKKNILICLTERFCGLIYFSRDNDNFNRNGIAKVDLNSWGFVYKSLVYFNFFLT